MKFRKKPVIIEAKQFNKYNIIEILSFCNNLPYFNLKNNTLIIPTLEGDMTAKEGDWIIKGIKGEFYPCKPDIFEQTYEKVEGEKRMKNKFTKEKY